MGGWLAGWGWGGVAWGGVECGHPKPLPKHGHGASPREWSSLLFPIPFGCGALVFLSNWFGPKSARWIFEFLFFFVELVRRRVGESPPPHSMNDHIFDSCVLFTYGWAPFWCYQFHGRGDACIFHARSAGTSCVCVRQTCVAPPPQLTRPHKTKKGGGNGKALQPIENGTCTTLHSAITSR